MDNDAKERLIARAYSNGANDADNRERYGKSLPDGATYSQRSAYHDGWIDYEPTDYTHATIEDY